MPDHSHSEPCAPASPLGTPRAWVEGAPSSSLWYACQQLERPPDPYVVWHYSDCKPCGWKAAFTIQQGGPGVSILARLMGIH